MHFFTKKLFFYKFYLKIILTPIFSLYQSHTLITLLSRILKSHSTEIKDEYIFYRVNLTQNTCRVVLKNFDLES